MIVFFGALALIAAAFIALPVIACHVGIGIGVERERLRAAEDEAARYFAEVRADVPRIGDARERRGLPSPPQSRPQQASSAAPRVPPARRAPRHAVTAAHIAPVITLPTADETCKIWPCCCHGGISGQHICCVHKPVLDTDAIARNGPTRTPFPGPGRPQPARLDTGPGTARLPKLTDTGEIRARGTQFIAAIEADGEAYRASLATERTNQ